SLAFFASLLFFGSVLAHELAHSLVAKLYGLPVQRITLFIFGGAANIEREPPTPKVEFLMTVVGPLVSMLLGVLFTLLAVVISPELTLSRFGDEPVMSRLSPLSTMLFWLGPINLMLGIFNLIPAFPLDGGRILRAFLWKLTGNLHRATRWAASVGQLIAILLVVSGIAMVFGLSVPFFGDGLVGGLWLIFISWFLYNAASRSYQQLLIHDLLEEMPIIRLMRRSVIVAPSGMTVSELVYEWIMKTAESSFPVSRDNQIIGLVCLEDVRKVPREEWDRATVDRIMTRFDQLDTVSVDEQASEALEKLSRRDVRQMPVVQDGRLVGWLRRRDIVNWLRLHSEVDETAAA